jgi:sugar phosphate isomerase/epimerase
MLNRRAFLGAAASAAILPAAGKKIPIGLELYSVRDELAKDLFGTVKAVAKMGYEGVEFFSPYTAWKPEYAKEVRKLLDDLNIKCMSTHNGNQVFAPANVGRVAELNTILGSKLMVMASAGRVTSIDGWKGVAETLSNAAEATEGMGIKVGFHNHKVEFVPLEGQMPMVVLAENTPKQVVLQLDIGTCIEAGVDPVKWIKDHPGRIVSVHCKDYAPPPGNGFLAGFGEGAAKWKDIFAAAEKTGGVEGYLIEWEGKDQPMETVDRCLKNYRKLKG